MTEEKNKSGPSGTHSLVETFHRVRSLVPDDQELVSVKPNTRVAEALKLMKKHHYSQLPVVVGKAVLGVFSYRSFSEKALTRQKTNKAEWLGDLPVEDFLEEHEFVHGSHDWYRILGYLNQDDAFFVGHRDGLDGLVTTMDVLDFYRQIATPFIVLAEIELSLRKVIQTSIPPEHRTKALEGSLTTAYEGRAVPMELNEMTFDNYVQIISNNGNWRYFEAMFDPGDVSRKLTVRKLQQLREWRNIVFHFKRELEPWEMDILSEHREWLQRRVRAFDAQQVEETATGTASKPKQGKTNRQQLLAAFEPAAAKYFSWLIDKADASNHIVYFGEKGFSVRKREGQGRISFAYGYPPDIFRINLKNLRLELEQETLLRQRLGANDLLEKRGKYTLQANVTEANLGRLREVFRRLLDHLAEPIT